jgi:CelD/BcsL family acetyltransferase involved in cellulose biosynthesis
VQFELVTNADRWSAYQADIDALLDTCAMPTPHSSTRWLLAWWSAMAAGDPDLQLRIGLWRRGSELIGYAPLMLRRERMLGIPYRVLEFVGHGISDYADLYSRRDAPDTLLTMLHDIVRTWEWDDLHLMNVREGSATLAAVAAEEARACFDRVVVNERCPYIQLDGRTFDEYCEALDGKYRRDLRRRRRKLDALGSWSVDFAPPITDELLDAFRRLHTERSQVMGWDSIHDLPGFRTLFRSVAAPATPDIEVLCSTLRLDGTLLAYSIGFVSKRVYYHWNIGSDASFDALAPSRLQHELLIQECFRRGYAEFDFMRGAYDYKLKWAGQLRNNYRIRMLRHGGIRWPLNRLRWEQEREAGSFSDRIIGAARSVSRNAQRATMHG